MSYSPTIQASNLPLGSVNPESPVPLYHQIEEDLRQLINTGKIPPEATLPPEMELCRAYGVGRHTVRMALSRLAADGLIYRRAGRGTFVKAQSSRIKFFRERSVSQQMADMGHQARTKVLDLSLCTINHSSSKIFANKTGSPCLKLHCLRFCDNEAIGIQHSTILMDRCPNLETKDFDQFGIVDILIRDYNLPVSQIQHAVSATTANEHQAEQLQIKQGDPLLVVHTTTYLTNKQPIEHTTSHYRADKYEYKATHTYE